MLRYGETRILVDLDNDGDLDYYDVNPYFDLSPDSPKVFRYVENRQYQIQELFHHREVIDDNIRITPENQDKDFFSGQNIKIPTIADLDNDGRLDWVVGFKDSRLAHYENTDPDKPYLPQKSIFNPIDSLQVGAYPVPTLADLDADGDLDLLVGIEDGSIQAFQNVGTPSTPTFTELKDAANPLANVTTGSHAFPSFADYDEDGDLDLALSSTYEQPRYYENIGTAQSPLFQERIGEENPLPNHTASNISPYASSINSQIIVMQDIDQDSDVDFSIRGSAQYSRNSTKFEDVSKSRINYVDTYHNIIENSRYTMETHPIKSNLFEDTIYTQEQTLSFACNDGCEALYYSVDRANFQQFEQPLLLQDTTTVTFYAGYPDGRQSLPQTQRYSIEIPPKDDICRIYVANPTRGGINMLTLSESPPFQHIPLSPADTYEENPNTQELFSVAGSQWLATISPQSARYVSLFSTAPVLIQHLTFHPVSGELWAWNWGSQQEIPPQGLYTIDIETQQTELMLEYEAEMVDITWDERGEYLYALEFLEDQNVLWRYDPANIEQSIQVCQAVIQDRVITAIDALPNGNLLFLERHFQRIRESVWSYMLVGCFYQQTYNRVASLS